MHELSDDQIIALAKLLTARLERLSADSSWARRASGLRGSLLRCLEDYSMHGCLDSQYLEYIIDTGFNILDQAARDLPVPKKL